MESVHFDNHKISIYSDYTNKVQGSRKGFLEVKAKLHSLNIQNMLLYPAWLKVLHDDKSNFFDMPEDVWKWLEVWDKVPPEGARSWGKETGTTWGTLNSNWRSREKASPQELSGGGASPNRIEIQEDGTMAVTHRDVTLGPTDMRTAVAEESNINGTAI
ncbi:hypothetical protein NDU88_006110 [Pleurodeles waltl]|uniref:Uncharacterized protein n=1 Tax=Pleurodeles waltl TaxID=8319 RepID=A0AAV7QMN6_PLEWA|nr:hypothetical protein NDU88_006110 [Pleurodeles waltl]